MNTENLNDIPEEANVPEESKQAEEWTSVGPIPATPPTEPESPVEPVTEGEVIPEVVSHSEPDPVQSQPFVYDPVLDESEPYIDVTPRKEGFQSAPSVDPSISAKPPVAEKKNSGWVIALIVVLILCLCICCGVLVVTMMVASGDYQIEWSSLLSPVFSMLRFF